MRPPPADAKHSRLARLKSIRGLETPTLLAEAMIGLVRHRLSIEWAGFSTYSLILGRPKATGITFTPRDFRPVSLEQGRAVQVGRFALAGDVLDCGQHGDPWDRASPSRAHAVQLHGFAWLPHLLATGEAGEREALRLFVAWRAEFEQITPFAWGFETLERRVFNLACGAPRMLAHASDLETRQLTQLLARQSRRLADIFGPASRRAERLAAACTGFAALADPAGGQLLRRWLPQLARALDLQAPGPEGLRTRSPEQGLELLYDLLTLEDILSQRGVTPPGAVSRAIDQLTRAVQFFTHRDGRLASFHGGESVGSDRIQGALQHDGGEALETRASSVWGFTRLTGRSIELIVDTAPPPTAAWSTEACDQPSAVEVTCGADRLFTNCGWSPAASAPAALRLATAGSTASLGGGSPGAVLYGLMRKALGPRLVKATRDVRFSLSEDDHGALIEISHDGWLRTTGAVHERRLFIDRQADELRGEDAFIRLLPPSGGRQLPFAVRFHLAPDVKVSLARDKRSVLLRGKSDKGWWFRNDAADVSVEPSMHYENGVARRTAQIVLRGWLQPSEASSRVRWKLAAVEPGHDVGRKPPTGQAL